MFGGVIRVKFLSKMLFNMSKMEIKSPPFQPR
jgi:hypothetical protein